MSLNTLTTGWQVGPGISVTLGCAYEGLTAQALHSEPWGRDAGGACHTHDLGGTKGKSEDLPVPHSKILPLESAPLHRTLEILTQ